MELIERYLQELARHLPKDGRDDTLAELRSSLTEGLGDTDEADEQTLDRLRQLGPPEELAASYSGRPRHLFRAELYGAFTRALGTVLWVVATLVALGTLTAGVPRTLAEGVALLGNLAGNLVEAGLTTLGALVALFWLIDRDSSTKPAHAKQWDPTSLPPLDDPDRVDRASLAIGLSLLAVLLVAINLFPSKLAATVRLGEHTTAMPLLGSSTTQWLPLLDIGLVGSFGVLWSAWRAGRWRRTLRWLEIGFDAITIAALGLMAATLELAAPTTSSLLAEGWPANSAEKLVALLPMVERLASVALAIVALIVLASGVRRISTLVRRAPTSISDFPAGAGGAR